MRIRRQAGSEDLVPRPVGVDGADIVIITIRAQDDGAHPSRENDLGAVWRPAGEVIPACGEDADGLVRHVHDAETEGAIVVPDPVDEGLPVG